MSTELTRSLENLTELFNSNSPESVKYIGKGVDTSWLSLKQKLAYAEQLTGVITEDVNHDLTGDAAVYMFYYSVANANDLQRLTAFGRMIQTKGN